MKTTIETDVLHLFLHVSKVYLRKIGKGTPEIKEIETLKSWRRRRQE